MPQEENKHLKVTMAQLLLVMEYFFSDVLLNIIYESCSFFNPPTRHDGVLTQRLLQLALMGMFE